MQRGKNGYRKETPPKAREISVFLLTLLIMDVPIFPLLFFYLMDIDRGLGVR